MSVIFEYEQYKVLAIAFTCIIVFIENNDVKMATKLWPGLSMIYRWFKIWSYNFFLFFYYISEFVTYTTQRNKRHIIHTFIQVEEGNSLTI